MTDLAQPDRSQTRPLLVDRALEGAAEVFTLRGEIDMSSGTELERELTSTVELEPDRIVIDMDGVSFMDSTGIRILLQAQLHAGERGVGLALRRVPPVVMRVIELTGVTDHFTFVTGENGTADEFA